MKNGRLDGNPVEGSASPDDALVRITDELVECLRRGQPVDRDQLARRYPDHQTQLDSLISAAEIVAGLASASEPERPSIGGSGVERLGDFEIVRELGRGGMGVVYEARQLSLNRRVALKILPLAGVLDARQLQRFKNEALAAAQLNHPHIVDVYGVGCERGVHYYAMRLIDGAPLSEAISDLRRRDNERRSGGEPSPPGRVSPEPDGEKETTRPLAPGVAGPADSGGSVPPPSRRDTAALAGLSTEPGPRGQFFRAVARIGIDVAESLHHAHEQGVIHRDIKPSNLLIDSRGKVWVADFGLAHIETEGDLTLSGELMGTLRYMSPEQAAGRRLGVDHRTDVYSLGVTLYELLSLECPFRADNRPDLLRQILFDEPRPLRKVRAEVPGDLETIVAKAIAKTPGDRYATAQEMADDLRRFADGQPIRARRVGRWEHAWRWARRNRGIATLSTALLTTLLIAAIGSTIVAFQMAKSRDEMKDLAARESTAADRAKRGEALAKENLYLALDALDQTINFLGSKEVIAYCETSPAVQQFRSAILNQTVRHLENFSSGTAENDSTFDFRRATALLRIAEAGYGATEGRQLAVDKASRILEEMHDREPDNLTVRLELARSYWHLFCYGPQDNPDHVQLNRAIDLLNPLVRQNLDNERLIQWWYYVVNARIGCQRNRIQRLDDRSLADVEMILRLSEEALSRWPDNTGWLSISASAKGLLANEPAPTHDERISMFEVTLKQLRRLEELDPSQRFNPTCVTVKRIAQEHEDAGRHDTAISILVDSLERELSLEPTSTSWAGVLQMSDHAARLLKKYGRHDQLIGLRRKELEKLRPFLQPFQVREIVDELTSSYAVTGNRFERERCLRLSLELARRQTAEGLNEQQTDFQYETARRCQALASHLVADDRLSESAELLREGLTNLENSTHDPMDHSARIQLLLDLCGCHFRMNDFDDVRRGLAHVESLLGPLRSQVQLLNESEGRITSVSGSVGPEVMDSLVGSYRLKVASLFLQVGDVESCHAQRAIAKDLARVPLAGVEDVEAFWRWHGKGRVDLFLNNFAWDLATHSDLQFRDVTTAIEMAAKAVRLEPDNAGYRNTLGVARYRNGELGPAVECLHKSIELGGGTPEDSFFLAMAEWKLGHEDVAREWLGKARRAVAERKAPSAELERFAKEAADLIETAIPAVD